MCHYITNKYIEINLCTFVGLYNRKKYIFPFLAHEEKTFLHSTFLNLDLERYNVDEKFLQKIYYFFTKKKHDWGEIYTNALWLSEMHFEQIKLKIVVSKLC